MGRKRKKCSEKTAVFQDPFDAPGAFIVPPNNPPGFGTERPSLRYASVFVTGQVLFDNPFYNTPPPPPLEQLDPCYESYLLALEAVKNRDIACPIGVDSPECTAAREAHFAAMRNYANALDKYWGLQRFQEPQQTPQQKPRQQQKNRT